MLKSHFSAVEQYLLAISKIPGNTGHPLHKGIPREAFIREFLQSHLSERIGIGTGEIIDANSRSEGKRNQIDIVLYKRDYPKLDIGGGVSAFLAEAVVATIEVKSTLNKAGLSRAMQTASNVKNLSRSIKETMWAGYRPPSILSYVVAYKGPAQMNTLYGWIKQIDESLGHKYPTMNDPNQRLKVPSPSLDGVFVLRKGFVHFDNTPLSPFGEEIISEYPQTKWIIWDTPDASLLFFFMQLTMAVSGFSASWLDPTPYIRDVSLEELAQGD